MKHSLSHKTLPNGIKVLFIDVPGVSSLDLGIVFNAGYRFATVDDPSKYETPHVLEHLVFDGSKNYPTVDSLQDIFQSGGGASNGMTNGYNVSYAFHARASNGEKVIRAALDMAFRPLLTEQSFDEEMKVIHNELSDNMGDYQGNAISYTIQQIVPDMPVSTDTQIDRLSNVTYQDVLDYFKKYFTTNNATIVITTDFKINTKSKIEKLILDETKGVPAGKHFDFPSFPVANKPSSIVYVAIGKQQNDSTASVQFVLPERPAKKDQIAMQLFTTLATDMKSYSANYKLRKMGLVYGLDFSAVESQESHGIELDITANNDRFLDVFAYSLENIRNFIRDGITKQQFEQARSDYIDGLQDSLNSAADIMGWYYYDFILDGTLHQPSDYKKIIETISLDHMLSYAQKLFVHDHMFGTVFSGKGVRAATSMDMLSQEILVKNKQVSEKLIADNSISLTSSDGGFKRIIYAAVVALTIVAFLPLTGLFQHPTLSSLLFTSVHIGIIFGLYMVYIAYETFQQQGKTLFRNVAGYSLIISAGALFIFGLDFDKALAIFTSDDFFVRLHANLFVGLLVAIPAYAGSLWLNKITKKNS